MEQIAVMRKVSLREVWLVYKRVIAVPLLEIEQASGVRQVIIVNLFELVLFVVEYASC
jgi:hypothetical protein